MYEIKNDSVVPPGGWRYVHAATGTTLTGATLGVLSQRVVDFLKANGLPVPPDVIGEIGDSLCRSYDEGTRRAYCRDTKGPRVRKAVGWREVSAFLTVIKEMIANKAGFVNQEEAERRAEICAGCPHNAMVTGCGVCRAVMEEARAELLGKTTSKDAFLRACGICGCSNAAQVHFPLGPLKASRPELVYPDHCWKK